MARVTSIATATVVAVFAASTLSVGAQQPDTKDRTIMTFSSAVELPGTRLDAGTYVFRLADTPSRNVIQVLDEQEDKVLGQWLFVPAERPEVTGDTVVTFRETSASATPAVQYWYYPGERIGKEFIYPMSQAVEIAKRTGSTVQTEVGPVNEDGPVASADTQPPAERQQAENAAGAAQEPAPAAAEPVGSSARAEQSEAIGTSGADTQADTAGIRQESVQAQNEPVPSELPATASPLMLSALLGLLSLAGAAGIRSFRQ